VNTYKIKEDTKLKSESFENPTLAMKFSTEV